MYTLVFQEPTPLYNPHRHTCKSCNLLVVTSYLSQFAYEISYICNEQVVDIWMFLYIHDIRVRQIPILLRYICFEDTSITSLCTILTVFLFSSFHFWEMFGSPKKKKKDINILIYQYKSYYFFSKKKKKIACGILLGFKFTIFVYNVIL